MVPLLWGGGGGVRLFVAMHNYKKGGNSHLYNFFLTQLLSRKKIILYLP